MLGLKTGRVGKQLASYATAAAARSEAVAEVQVERLSSGLTVASLQRDWPMARVSLVLRAGARHEDHESRGMSHFLRRASGLATSEHTALGLTRSVMQIGAALQCSATREHIIYSMDVSGDLLSNAFTFLANTATRPHFYHWELSDNTYPYMMRDVEFLHRRDHTTLLFEKLHEAAYGDTLGRSLFAPAHKIGDYSFDQISNFCNAHFALDRAALVGSGVPHQKLVELSELLNLTAPGVAVPNKAAAHFRGGESRVDAPSGFTQVAIASESAGLDDAAGSLAFAVLAHALGHGAPNVVWGSAHSPLATAVAGACSRPAHACAVNFSYSDSGLFGFYVAANPEEAGAAVKAARSVLVNVAKSGVKAEDLERAKAQLKTSILLDAEANTNAVTDLGIQASLFGEGASSVAATAARVDSVTVDQVNKVAKKLLTTKAAMASVGNLGSVPFLSDFA